MKIRLIRKVMSSIIILVLLLTSVSFADNSGKYIANPSILSSEMLGKGLSGDFKIYVYMVDGSILDLEISAEQF
ncbi:hypothetical protein [Paenibacillus bouchesdurhonensis]|uniref:hypothetical protein n=1 Tax=Paenibacillus bouchesdurhonensis TaxID=1870990 RepID=UPI000DA62C0A|nr:hypothetical protein [Paenibacillus bouchesdurhonensis]